MFHGDFLHFVGIISAHQVEDRADLAITNHFSKLIGVTPPIALYHLTDFFFQGHFVDKLGDFLFRLVVDPILPKERQGDESKQGKKNKKLFHNAIRFLFFLLIQLRFFSSTHHQDCKSSH